LRGAPGVTTGETAGLSADGGLVTPELSCGSNSFLQEINTIKININKLEMHFVFIL
jgi:hypothetical protein